MAKRTLTAAGLQIQLFGSGPYEFTWNEGRAVGLGTFSCREEEGLAMVEAVVYSEGNSRAVN